MNAFEIITDRILNARLLYVSLINLVLPAFICDNIFYF